MDEHYSDATFARHPKADKKYRGGRGKPKSTTPQLFRGPLSWVKGV
jgi:hypothetical protein